MKQKFLYVLSLIIILGLFIFVAFNSYGYDDEFYNFNMIERVDSLSELISVVNSSDIHPSGMYVINYILLKLFGTWRAVKVISAIFAASFIWLFWYIMSKNMSRSAIILSYILICLNPTLLLWCTSVRWYTYFTPLLCVIGLLVKYSDSTKIKSSIFWILYFLLCLIMFHLNYIASIFIITSFLFVLYGRRKFISQEFKFIIGCGFVSLLLVSYQVYILFTVHYPNSTSTGFFIPFTRISVGAGLNYLCGNAVIPVSIAGIMLITANIIMLIFFLLRIKKFCRNINNNFLIGLYSVTMFLFPGGMSPSSARQFSTMLPELGIFLANIYETIKNNYLKFVLLFLYSAGTIMGLYNVIAHTDTNKIRWNIPYGEIFDYIAELDPSKEILIVTDDDAILYYKSKEHRNILYRNGNVGQDEDLPEKITDWKGSVIVLRGHSPKSKKYLDFLNQLDSDTNVKKNEFGIDKFAWFKRKIDKEITDYLVKLYFIDRSKIISHDYK